MIPNTNYGETITSGQMETGTASIELTPEMFTLLSSGMYTDKILAAIREPICNARDAQVDSEDGVPLEMHLPTQLEPFFHIRDFGTGLSERQVLGYKEMQQSFNSKTGEPEEVEVAVPGLYLRYGKSTKRDSNLQIGGFGIGCKAPLAYSDSFIVESYQQGVVKTYTIYKENGIPNVAKLNEKMTTEQDGLKVKIAVVNSDIGTFVAKAGSFLKFFNYPVDITGQRVDIQVKRILTTDLYDTIETDYRNQGMIKASMGGVVYSVSDTYREELEQVAQNNMLIMKFKIGDLSVAGSREALSEDEETLEKLDQAVKTIKEEFYAVMRAEVEDTKHSPFEALQLLSKFGLVSRNTWRDPTPKLKAAAKGFMIGDEDAEVVMTRYSEIKVRNIKGNEDMMRKLDGYSDIPMVIVLDKQTGFIKVARKLSKDLSGIKNVVLVSNSEDLGHLQKFFGKDNLTVEKVSVKYEELFPKGSPSTKIRVAASGLFTTSRAEIREMDESQEGYYIPFERSSCIMDGKPDYYGGFSSINTVITALIQSGQLKADEVFYSRKAGMRAIRKTKLKELTWAKVMVMAKKSYGKKDYRNYVVLNGHKSGNPAANKHSLLQPFWESVKHNYPAWSKTKEVVTTKGVTFLSESGLIKQLEVGYEDDLVKIRDKYNAEETQFGKDYPLIAEINRWGLTEGMVTDIIGFYKWKEIQNRVKKRAA
jgi:hypothetical protein